MKGLSSVLVLFGYLHLRYVVASEDILLRLRDKSLQSPHCGTGWQDEYKKLHADIRSDKAPLRYFIVAHDGQGANDRLTSLITGFFAALISNRAFFLVKYLG